MDSVGEDQDKAAWRREQLADLKLVFKWCRRFIPLAVVLRVGSVGSLDWQRHIPIDWTYISIGVIIFAVSFIPIERLIREEESSREE